MIPRLAGQLLYCFQNLSLPSETGRGLIGFRNSFLAMTSGTGKALTYSLETLQSRGKLFLEPGQEIYEGQLAGIHSCDNDLVINPTKQNKCTRYK